MNVKELSKVSALVDSAARLLSLPEAQWLLFIFEECYSSLDC